MIKYDSKIWFRHLARFHKSDTSRILFWEILIVGAYTGGLAYLFTTYLPQYQSFKNITMVHSIIGFVLSLLLVFRTNSAYDRWWEGRKHWGALVNNTRNLAIKLNTVLGPDRKEDREFFERMIPNFVVALKEHLRKGVILEELNDDGTLVKALANKKHQPNYIIAQIYKRIKKLYAEGVITGDEYIILDKELKSFTDIMGACERIRHTPIPFSYNIFLKKFILFYVITIPVGFIAQFEYWAIPISMFIFYVLVSLEIIAEEIEDPFGTDENDLPTNELTVKIRDNVVEIFED